MPGEIDCLEDMQAFDRELDDPWEELEQDLLHRLIEPPGSNIDDPERGLGLRSRLSGIDDPNLGRDIELEWEKDDRVEAVRALVTRPDSSASPQQGVLYLIETEVETVNGDTFEGRYAFDGSEVRRVA